MKELNINQNWTFKEVVDNLESLRTDYEGILATFSYFDLHEKVLFLKNTRDSFYSLNLQDWEKDKIWSYMNGFEFLYTLKEIILRRK